MEWYKKVKQKIKRFKSAEVIFWDKPKMSDALKSEPNNYYDIVLVDSNPRHSRRLDLANGSVDKLKTGGWLIVDNYQKFGMDGFDYSKWQVYTFDEFHYTGLGTKLCRKIF